MKELNQMEIEQVSGGLEWWKGERSTNVFYTNGAGETFQSNIYGGWTRIYIR
ncbi:hypothetical protein [Dyella sp. RRB7]|jgi:hypothetical protein|uniref:hypothetical protein n=1 Tax=Dyella sp. RRB7 TaxID=2919502 RepID=UPI001FA983AB|nr:hypothetical protein [Dyella sp. RRB7]